MPADKRIFQPYGAHRIRFSEPDRLHRWEHQIGKLKYCPVLKRKWVLTKSMWQEEDFIYRLLWDGAEINLWRVLNELTDGRGPKSKQRRLLGYSAAREYRVKCSDLLMRLVRDGRLKRIRNFRRNDLRLTEEWKQRLSLHPDEDLLYSIELLKID